MPSPPVNRAALEQYRKRANIYDLELAALEPIRRRAIEQLQLKPGATVLDVGCGTGMSFEGMEAAIGPRGRIVGVEQSPDMLGKARERVALRRWRNVTLVNAAVQAADIPVQADATMFHFTHDILRNRAAVQRMLHTLKPGARVVASGLKWAPLWAVATNGLVLAGALRSVTTLEGLRQPWSHLAALLGDMTVTPTLLGGAYIAVGQVPKGREAHITR